MMSRTISAGIWQRLMAAVYVSKDEMAQKFGWWEKRSNKGSGDVYSLACSYGQERHVHVPFSSNSSGVRPVSCRVSNTLDAQLRSIRLFPTIALQRGPRTLVLSNIRGTPLDLSGHVHKKPCHNLTREACRRTARGKQSFGGHRYCESLSCRGLCAMWNRKSLHVDERARS